jgi:hypothetical protein
MIGCKVSFESLTSWPALRAQAGLHLSCRYGATMIDQSTHLILANACQ